METTQTLTELERFTKAAGEIISPAFISTDPYEIEATSADLSLLPKYHYKFKEEFRATHVVRPKNIEELKGIMALCRKSAFPVTIRAAGTSCYSASSPTKGGVVVDMRRMNTVHEVNVDTRTVRCDAGISWLKLNSALLDYGLAPMVYPTSFKSGCVGGYVATAGKAGIGSAKHGGIADTLVSVTMVKPDGTVEGRRPLLCALERCRRHHVHVSRNLHRRRNGRHHPRRRVRSRHRLSCQRRCARERRRRRATDNLRPGPARRHGPSIIGEDEYGSP